MQVAERAEGGENDALANHGARCGSATRRAFDADGIRPWGVPGRNALPDVVVRRQPKSKPNPPEPVLWEDVGGINYYRQHKHWRLAMNAEKPGGVKRWVGVLFVVVLAAFSGAAAAEI